MAIKTISIEQLNSIVKDKGCNCIIDVREASEYKSEHVEGSQHIPLSTIHETSHTKDLDTEQAVYIMCRTGMRAKKAADQMQSKGFNNIHIVEGGIEAWKSLGLTTLKNKTNIWSLERQVRFTAGLLVMLGFVASSMIHSNFIYLSAGVAFGLMFSALTNTCGMGMLLMKMPWNR
ncbi:MAG TPA: rhodanese-like domain-containing protein [Oligoflexia bacterium]|nr:rhodanese-like domain-containing protein [Oligoflexia bacterium]HMR25068.1 rhodanese-like domain-containing protein [Oligoflexia bacterium]